MATIQLEIVSPDKVVYSADISMLIVRSTGGELGILPHHAPLVTGLMPHAMRVRLGGDRDEQLIAVAGGFMEVTPEKIMFWQRPPSSRLILISIVPSRRWPAPKNVWLSSIRESLQRKISM